MQLCHLIDVYTLTLCRVRATRQVGVLEGIRCLTLGAARASGKVSESCICKDKFLFDFLKKLSVGMCWVVGVDNCWYSACCEVQKRSSVIVSLLALSKQNLHCATLSCSNSAGRSV